MQAVMAGLLQVKVATLLWLSLIHCWRDLSLRSGWIGDWNSSFALPSIGLKTTPTSVQEGVHQHHCKHSHNS